MIARTLLETLSPLMRHLAQRLEQKQAFVREGRIDAAPAEVGGQPGVIQFRGVASERELEAILPGEFPVARAHVAARAREHRLNVLPKGDGAFVLSRARRHRNFHGLAAELDQDLCHAIGQRAHRAVGGNGD